MSGILYSIRTPLRVLGIIILIGLGLGFAYFLTLLGPQKVSDEDIAQMDISEQQVSELLSKAEALQEQFADMQQLRTPTEEDFALLEESVENLETAFESSGGTSGEIRETLLEARRVYQNARAKDLVARSNQFERELVSVNPENKEQLLILYGKAIDLQKQINEDYPLSDYRDVNRISRLVREKEAIEARPLYFQTLEAEKKAEEAIAKSEWEEADKALLEAIRIQKDINAQYSNLQYADSSRLTRLERDRISLKSGRYYERVLAFEKEGEMAMEAGNYREAAAAFVQAARVQEALNREYDESRFASLSRLEDLRSMREDALGTELAVEIKAQLEEIDSSLRKRNVWEATEKIQVVNQKIEQFIKAYPRNTQIDENAQIKVKFLSYIQDDIVLLQDRIYGQLMPIPDEDNWHILRTEVTQALFSSIMLNNPSRNRGELYPVDSITWDEAMQFCEKVSWLLARQVRLPTRAEYLNGVGSLRYVKLDEISWNQQNSDGLPHEVATKAVNEAGYYDLLGNVAEWLESSELPGTVEAYLAGGSAETSIDILADKPIEIVSRRTRNRMNGFRIAVDLSND